MNFVGVQVMPGYLRQESITLEDKKSLALYSLEELADFLIIHCLSL